MGEIKWENKSKKRVLLLPRIARDYSEIGVYHIINRGIDKQNIFLDENDKYKFMNDVKETKEKYKYELYSYCLMDNHVHFVIFDKEKNISKVMQSIGVSYSFYFNKKYERTGHLFQNRFFSKKVEDREYLKIVCRYIHQNPLKAGVAKTENYKWSSYQKYLKIDNLVDTRQLLLIFSEDEEIAKNEFIKFHNINDEINKEIEIKNIMEFEMCEKLTDREVEKYVCDLLNIENVHEILKYNIEIRNEKLSKLKSLKKVSIVQLSRVIGINRKMIERAIKK